MTLWCRGEHRRLSPCPFQVVSLRHGFSRDDRGAEAGGRVSGCLLWGQEGAGPAAARGCPARWAAGAKCSPGPSPSPCVPASTGLQLIHPLDRLLSGSSGPSAACTVWSGLVWGLCVTREPWSHSNMLVGLALHLLGKKIISLDKRFLPLWRFWALYPNPAVAGGGGNPLSFSPSFYMLSSGGRRFPFHFLPIFFHSFALGCYDIILTPQKGKLRKQASSLQ